MSPATQRSFRAMGTGATLVLHTADASAALDAAQAEVDAIERRFSRFLPDSELSRLNARSGSWVRVSADMAAVLDLAREAHAATRGLFEPAILPDLERAGYDRTFEHVEHVERVRPTASPAADRARFAFAEVERDGDRVRLPHGARIDLGGIVKGWAADRIADLLATTGPALVDLGGDIAVRGTPPGGDAWRVAVERPDGTDGPLALLRMTSGGVATSGTYRRRWTADRQMHHLIDPRTGTPGSSELAAVVALHPRAVIADVWAKCVLLERPERRAALVASCAGLDVILVPLSGTPVATEGAHARCVARGSASDVAA